MFSQFHRIWTIENGWVSFNNLITSQMLLHIFKLSSPTSVSAEDQIVSCCEDGFIPQPSAGTMMLYYPPILPLLLPVLRAQGAGQPGGLSEENESLTTA